MNGCAWSFVLFVVGLIVIVIAQSVAREKARRAYRAALDDLKNDPANPHLREETLRLGRHYAYLMRKQRGRTLFDEVALMNDINAACAAVTVQRQVVAHPARPSVSIEDRLTRLHELKTSGLISQAEYDERRREILREV